MEPGLQIGVAPLLRQCSGLAAIRRLVAKLVALHFHDILGYSFRSYVRTAVYGLILRLMAAAVVRAYLLRQLAERSACTGNAV